MINSLRIKNFKGWKDTGKIEFAPITLFMGSNSSGKSSIGQFLMLLKQSSTSADRKTVLFFSNDCFAAYFANNDVSPSRLEPLDINLFGEIVNWPKNFFGDMNGDIFAQTSAALQRQINGDPK